MNTDLIFLFVSLNFFSVTFIYFSLNNFFLSSYLFILQIIYNLPFQVSIPKPLRHFFVWFFFIYKISHDSKAHIKLRRLSAQNTILT